MRFKEVKGHWPLVKPKEIAANPAGTLQDGAQSAGSVVSGKGPVMTERKAEGEEVK